MKQILIVLLFSIVAELSCSGAAFIDNAAEHVSAGFKRITRGGKTLVDVTKIEVKWKQ